MARTRQTPPLTKKLAASETSASLVDELRVEIKRVVANTTPSTYPAVHARMTDLAGYLVVEDAIIQYVLFNHAAPSAALAQLENEWGGIA
jgi:hypothetical protein